MKALAGDLSEFPLTDIIQLIDLSKKTGSVDIEGHRGSKVFKGQIYFRDGKIIGADMPGHAPLDAVYTFFTVSGGPFHFRDNIVIDEPTITVSNEVIIMEGIMRQDLWQDEDDEAEASLLAMVPRLVPNPTSGSSDINLQAEEWRILTMVNGTNTVEQISKRSGLGENRTTEIIKELLNSGLIEERPEAGVS
jgi:hypothetical protein